MIALPAEALSRSRIFTPCADDATYDALFRAASPVPAPTWSSPGSPPHLEHRATFDDLARNNRLRSERIQQKWRYGSGRVGYIFGDELEWFVGAFFKENGGLTDVQRVVYNTLDREGPMPVSLIKEISGLLVKEISPALQSMQQAFIVFEDQIDYEWDRAFYILEKEMPDVDPSRYAREEALGFFMARWIYLCGSADAAMLSSLSGMPQAAVKDAMRLLVAQGKAQEDGAHNLHAMVTPEGLEQPDGVPARHVVALEAADFLIRAHQRALTRLHGTGVIKTLLIDGHLAGHVKGRFRFGPADVDDVRVEAAFADRRDEILAVVAAAFPESGIKHFNGEVI